jgi:hypothetical protein
VKNIPTEHLSKQPRKRQQKKRLVQTPKITITKDTVSLEINHTKYDVHQTVSFNIPTFS